MQIELPGTLKIVIVRLSSPCRKGIKLGSSLLFAPRFAPFASLITGLHTIPPKSLPRTTPYQAFLSLVTRVMDFILTVFRALFYPPRVCNRTETLSILLALHSPSSSHGHHDDLLRQSDVWQELNILLLTE